MLTTSEIKGMELRDYFAGQALVGYRAHPANEPRKCAEQVAEYCYNLADAMLNHSRLVTADMFVPHILYLVKDGRMIKAIEEYRRKFGTDLVESKEAVEKIMRDNGIK